MTTLNLGNDRLSIAVSSTGAELRSLVDVRRGRELLWQGDAAWWGGRAPFLFPIIGRLRDDRILIDGRAYAMSQHGFARTSTFDVAASSSDHLQLNLTANETTLEQFPFPFVLTADYRLAEGTLVTVVTVANTGARPMPFSFGFHPGFAWPLTPGAARYDHTVTFEMPEPAPVRRIADGLMTTALEASPVVGHTLALHDDLFSPSVIIFDQLASRAVTYAVPGGPAIRVAFPDLPHLGLWTKRGAPFLCIEPWQGFASPADFDGELADKPGVVTLDAGARRSFTMAITLLP